MGESASTTVGEGHTPRSAVVSGLPPGPRLPATLQTVLALFANDPYRRYCQRRFDSMVRLKATGVGEIVSVWDPELIKQVLTGDPDVLRGGEANASVLLAPAGENSVMVLDGERHLRTRRLLSPPLHGQAVSRYERLVSRLAIAEVERWRVGETIATRPRMQAIALEVILQAVIGVRDERRLERLRSLLARVAGASVFAFAAESAYPRLGAGPFGSRLPWIAARRQAETLLFEEIAEHRADPEGREDILALLLGVRGESEPLSDVELKDQMLTLLVAGHESTATVLSWCFERLVRHPPVLERLRRELGGEEGERYLDAVVNETLRARPVVEIAARRLSAPLELGGYLLPAGTTVGVSIGGVQRSEVYDDAEEFRPERFLDRSAPPYTLVPFGGGTHRCIGASFALMEIKSVLRAVLERVELRAPTMAPERAVRWRRVTVIPSRGGRVVVSARVARAPRG
jgi:cytochrome P450